jgi:hypothetical protein
VVLVALVLRDLGLVDPEPLGDCPTPLTSHASYRPNSCLGMHENRRD